MRFSIKSNSKPTSCDPNHRRNFVESAAVRKSCCNQIPSTSKKEISLNLQKLLRKISLRTWLVLLEFRECPNSPAFCCCALRFWLLLTGAMLELKTVISGVSEVSLIPESVIMEETIDCGSTSSACWYSSPATADFFFVSEPQPDEPEAMEASSLELTVCRPVTALGLAAIKLDGVGLLIRFMSGSVGAGFSFEEGLRREMGSR